MSDITLLRLVSGPTELVDTDGAVRVANQRLVPLAVFKRGTLLKCATPKRAGSA